MCFPLHSQSSIPTCWDFHLRFRSVRLVKSMPIVGRRLCIRTADAHAQKQPPMSRRRRRRSTPDDNGFTQHPNQAFLPACIDVVGAFKVALLIDSRRVMGFRATINSTEYGQTRTRCGISRRTHMAAYIPISDGRISRAMIYIFVSGRAQFSNNLLTRLRLKSTGIGLADGST